MTPGPGGGLRRLELPRGAALLQARRRQPALRRRVPRHGGPLGVSMPVNHAADLRRLHPRRAGGGHPLQLTISTARARTASASISSRQRNAPPLLGLGAYLAPVRGRAEPDGQDGRHGDADPRGARPRGRRRVRRGRRGAYDPLRARGARHLGRLRLARSSCCNPASARPITCARSACRRTRPARASASNLQDHLDLFVICECTGDHTYRQLCQAPPHCLGWAAILCCSRPGRSPRASSRPAASGSPTRRPARPTFSSISASAPASRPASRS